MMKKKSIRKPRRTAKQAAHRRLVNTQARVYSRLAALGNALYDLDTEIQRLHDRAWPSGRGVTDDDDDSEYDLDNEIQLAALGNALD